MRRNPEGVQRKGAIVSAVMSGLMTAFFALVTEVWTWPVVLFIGWMAAFTLGLAAHGISPEKGWRGLRLVAFLLFAGFFANLAFGSPADPVTALAGFVSLGLPALAYSLWGTTLGRAGDPQAKSLTRADRITQVLLVSLHLVTIGASIVMVAIALWRLV